MATDLNKHSQNITVQSSMRLIAPGVERERGMILHFSEKTLAPNKHVDEQPSTKLRTPTPSTAKCMVQKQSDTCAL